MATRKKAAKPAKKTAAPAATKKRSNPDRLEGTAGLMRYHSELGIETAKGEYESISGAMYDVCQEAAALCDAGQFHAARACADKLPASGRAGLPAGGERKIVHASILLVIAAAEVRYERSQVLGFVQFGARSSD